MHTEAYYAVMKRMFLAEYYNHLRNELALDVASMIDSTLILPSFDSSEPHAITWLDSSPYRTQPLPPEVNHDAG